MSTTTKHDVYELTSGVRAWRGPVHVFNPQQIGGVPSTFRWNPLDGCEDPAVAIRRADAFASAVSHKGVEDASFWAAKASDYLRGYFHAAALAGMDLRRVALWVSGTAQHEPEDILATNSGAARHLAAQLAEMRGEANKTISTVRMTMSRALAFLADPALAACVLPSPGQGLDIPEFLRQAGTLYLIAEPVGEDAPVAPLFACLTTEIHHTAALLGSRAPGGRLDPPLLMALDEVTQICPVPVPSWLADSGGKGIQIITVAHGEAQLRDRWGTNGARIIMDTSGAKIWLPGISDPDTLDAASRLCGTTALKEARTVDLGPPGVPRLLRPPPGHDTRDDPPAPRTARPHHPRRHVPRHRPPAHGLERPRLQESPPRRACHRGARSRTRSTSRRLDGAAGTPGPAGTWNPPRSRQPDPAPTARRRTPGNSERT